MLLSLEDVITLRLSNSEFHRINIASISTRLRPVRSGVRISVGPGDFFFPLLQNVQSGSGAHPAYYLMGTRSFPGRVWIGGDVKVTTHIHLVPRSRMSGVLPLLPASAFMVWTGKHFTFYQPCMGSCIRLHRVQSEGDLRMWTVLVSSGERRRVKYCNRVA